MSLDPEFESLGSRPDKTLAGLGRTLEGDALFQKEVRFGINGSYSVRLCNALLSECLRKRSIRVRVLDHMKEENDGKKKKNQHICEILLNYYVSAGRLEDFV